MIIKCIKKFGKDLPADALVPRDGFDIEQVFQLDLNKNYVVYGMILYSGYVWYYLADESFLYYPFWNPSPLFEIVDPRLSRYWIYSFKRDKRGNGSSTKWTYPEWLENDYYYNLIEGEEKEVEIFKRYKALMDLEFPDPSIIEKATILDQEWLMCPPCIDAWQSISEDGMVICPKCKRFLHNPRYKDRLKKLNFVN